MRSEGVVQLANNTHKEAQLSRYLLGGLSEAERALFEEEYFADDEAFEQALIAEEELIDAYVGGELSEEQRGRFEELFMRSQLGRERLYFARDLVGVLSDASLSKTAQNAKRAHWIPFLAALRTQGAALRFALTAAILAIVVGFPWLLIDRARMHGELRRLRDERAELNKRTQELEQRSSGAQTRIVDLLAQLESERARSSPDKSGKEPPPSSIITFILTPGLVRGNSAKALRLPRDASSVVLRLNMEAGAYVSYRAVIETTTKREVWRVDSVKPPQAANAGGIIALPPLPAKALPSGDYVLLLSGKRPDGGFEGVADYSFMVVRK
jgi:hypothetical protein